MSDLQSTLALVVDALERNATWLGSIAAIVVIGGAIVKLISRLLPKKTTHSQNSIDTIQVPLLASSEIKEPQSESTEKPSDSSDETMDIMPKIHQSIHSLDNGSRWGGEFGEKELTEVISFCTSILTDCTITRDTHPRQWILASATLCNALSSKALKSVGPQGTQLLQDAIACGRDAWSGAYAPDNLLERMELGNALASALSIRGVWQGGEQGKKDLSESIKICQMLLEAGIDSQSTVAYALLRETLANAKIKTAVREQDKEGLRLLDQAIPLLQKVLLQYAGGRDRDRESRARIQNTIADAHRYYALRRGGWRWRNRIDKAVKAHREALDTLGDHGQYPVQMAAIYNDLGNTLRNKAVRGSDADRIAYLDEAIAAFRMALKVRKREYHPVAWSGTYNNLGIAYNDMGEVLIDRNQANDIKSGETYIKRAVIAYRWALKIRTSDAQSIPWAMSQDNLGSALTDLANVKMRQGTWEGTREGLVLLQEAERCFCAALELYTEEYNANDRVNTQLNLAYAYFVMSVGAIHHATENVKEAGGLEFYTKTSKKWQRGLTRLNALAREVAKQDSRPYTRDQKERR